MLSQNKLLPPAYVITPDDHGGYAVIAAAICMLFVLLFLTAKLTLRWLVLHGDDWTAITASVSSFQLLARWEESILREDIVR